MKESIMSAFMPSRLQCLYHNKGGGMGGSEPCLTPGQVCHIGSGGWTLNCVTRLTRVTRVTRLTRLTRVTRVTRVTRDGE